MDALPCADIGVEEGQPFRIGDIELHPLFTPGHTDTHHAYLVKTDTHTLLFSGDALLIEACGRTDFQSGDPARLYQSITQKFFTLPDETLVYPAHDYEERCITTIGQEKQRNPRVGKGTSQQAFIDIMEGLDPVRPTRWQRRNPAVFTVATRGDAAPHTGYRIATPDLSVAVFASPL